MQKPIIFGDMESQEIADNQIEVLNAFAAFADLDVRSQLTPIEVEDDIANLAYMLDLEKGIAEVCLQNAIDMKTIKDENKPFTEIQIDRAEACVQNEVAENILKLGFSIAKYPEIKESENYDRFIASLQATTGAVLGFLNVQSAVLFDKPIEIRSCGTNDIECRDPKYMFSMESDGDICSC